MKKVFIVKHLIPIIFLISMQLYSQENIFSKIIFNKPQNGINSSSVVMTFDHNYLISGYADYMKNVGAGFTYCQGGLIFEVDSTGNLMWNKVYYPEGFSFNLNQIIRSIDSNYVIIGMNAANAFIAEINPEGDTIWTRELKSNANTFNLEAYSIEQTLDSGYILAGSAIFNEKPYSQVFIAKLKKDGNLDWAKRFYGANNVNLGSSIRQTPDSGYILTGAMENYPPADIFSYLIKLDASGNFQWSKKYTMNDSYYQGGIDIRVLKNNFLWAVNGGILKTDFSGNVLWAEKNGSLNFDNLFRFESKLKMFSDSTYGICSYSDYGPSTFFEIDTSGNIISQNNLFLIRADVTPSADYGYFAVGNGPFFGVSQETHYESHIGIIKTDSAGNGVDCVWTSNTQMTDNNTVSEILSISAIQEDIVQTSSSFTIDTLDLGMQVGCVDVTPKVNEISKAIQTYITPNPNNGTFNVSSGIAFDDNTILELCDLTGKILMKVTIEDGTNTSEINCTNLQSGLYLYRIYDNKNTFKTGKIIIEK